VADLAGTGACRPTVYRRPLSRGGQCARGLALQPILANIAAHQRFVRTSVGTFCRMAVRARVGWVERSETHQWTADGYDGFTTGATALVEKVSIK
jgi:hypothetical protein